MVFGEQYWQTAQPAITAISEDEPKYLWAVRQLHLLVSIQHKMLEVVPDRRIELAICWVRASRPSIERIRKTDAAPRASSHRSDRIGTPQCLQLESTYEESGYCRFISRTSLTYVQQTGTGGKI